MTVGEKIKQIRTEKGFSQDYIYSNQSLVSQIEKGINKNPSETILRHMAQKLEVAFDELIEGTEWEIPRKASIKSEYAFSQTECVVKIEDSGEIKTRMKSYPLTENSGEENKFDPDTGYTLLNACKNCNRAIQQPNQMHCFGCGEKLFCDYWWYEDVFTGSYFFDEDELKEVDIEGWEQTLPHITTNHFFDSRYTIDPESNTNTIARLTNILFHLKKIDYVLTHSGPSISSSRLNYADKEILTDIVNKDYYQFFKGYYYFIGDGTGMDEHLEKYTATGQKIEVGDRDYIDDSKGGFDIYVLSNFHPKVFPSKSEFDYMVKWWIQFKYDLCMTKGLLNEMLRHQKRLLAIAETEGEKTNEKPNETEPNEEG